MSRQEGVPADSGKGESMELPKEFVASAIAWSFYHSQGDPKLQTDILNYFGLKMIQDGKTLPRRNTITPELLAPHVLKAISSIPRHSKISRAEVGKAALTFVDDLYHGFGDWALFVKSFEGKGEKLTNLLHRTTELITLQIVQRDAGFYNFRKRANSERPSSFNVPSHFLAYSLNGETPPGGYGTQKYFKDMYEDCKMCLEEHKGDDDSLDREYNLLLEIIDKDRTEGHSSEA